jgi:fused signal recognition particle receptor
MRRWFRRQEKGQEESPEEREAPPEDAALESSGAEEAAASPETESLTETDTPVGAGSPRPYDESSFGKAETEPTEAEAEAAPEEALEARKGLLRRFKERLSRTRDTLAGGLDRILKGRQEVDAALLEELEELLITADLGVETTLFLIQALQEKLRRRELGDVERLRQALREEMAALLQAAPPREIDSRPWVVLLVGVNGVGKTTTIAKLAHRDRHQGLSTMLVAADTFRAAAAEQLEIWGERVGAPVIRQKAGADPAAVVFDGLSAALARDVDTVYLDTAGRLHTKVNLMEELKKVHRTAAKKVPGAPHEVLLILDATTGQNALSQAREFHEAVAVSGIILTKMDGTAKGGVALAVAHETGIPIRYLGVGEAMDDLRPFEAEAFVEAILG